MQVFVALVSEGLIPDEPNLFVSKDRRDQWVREALEEQSHDTLAAMVYNAIENHTIEEFPYDGDPDREPKDALIPALMRAVQLGVVYDEDVEIRTWVTDLDTRGDDEHPICDEVSGGFVSYSGSPCAFEASRDPENPEEADPCNAHGGNFDGSYTDSL